MKSIAIKLWLGMMALVGVVLILLWLFQIVFLESFYTWQRMSGLQKEAGEIITLLEQGDPAAFQERVSELAYNGNISVELLDQNQEQLYAVGTLMGMGPMGMLRNSIRQEVVAEALAGEISRQEMNHPRYQTQMMLIGLPVHAGGGSQALLLTVPLAATAETAAILKNQLVYITLILLLVSLGISFILARSFARPLRDMTAVAQAMAAGNLAARTGADSLDEIGRLGQAINRMGEELQKIDGLRRELIANISHELRTPLTIIKGYAEAIRDISGSQPEKRSRQLQVIIEETDRLSTIVDDVLHLSQLQAGYLPLEQGTFNIDQTLERIRQRFEIIVSQTGVATVLENRVPAAVRGDEGRIEQVLYNLVSNAINHSNPGSQVVIRTREIERGLRIEVADSGSGIPAAELPLIWDRFYKADKSGQRSRAGSGLGLAIVKSVLTAHGAPFGVQSQVGQGSTFWFELQRAESS